MTEDFVANLNLLCGYHPSVTEVCRRLKINRPQFMKYLSGLSFPSRYTLRRICDFFGVEEYEILMPHRDFGEIVKVRSPRRVQLPPIADALFDHAAHQGGNLARYTGYYFRNFYSFSAAGLILRSLVRIYQDGGYTLYKTLERLRRPNMPSRNTFLFKYSGVVFLVGNRLHLVDYETIQGNEVSHTILYPPSTNRVSTLIGLMMGISGTERFQPVAARVFFEHIGTTIDHREALRRCGLFSAKSGEIDPAIVDYIGGPATEKSHLLRAE